MISDNYLPHGYQVSGNMVANLHVVHHESKPERPFLLLSQACIKEPNADQLTPTFSLPQLAGLDNNEKNTTRKFIEAQEMAHDFSGFVVTHAVQNSFKEFVNIHNLTRLTDDNYNIQPAVAPLLHELKSSLFIDGYWSNEAESAEIRLGNTAHAQAATPLHQDHHEDEKTVVWTLQGPSTRFIPRATILTNDWMHGFLSQPEQYQNQPAVANYAQQLIITATQVMPDHLIACFDGRELWHGAPDLTAEQARTVMVLSGYEGHEGSESDLNADDGQVATASDAYSSNQQYTS